MKYFDGYGTDVTEEVEGIRATNIQLETEKTRLKRSNSRYRKKIQEERAKSAALERKNGRLEQRIEKINMKNRRQKDEREKGEARGGAEQGRRTTDN